VTENHPADLYSLLAEVPVDSEGSSAALTGSYETHAIESVDEETPPGLLNGLSL
jgi:hypothetical protein